MTDFWRTIKNRVRLLKQKELGSDKIVLLIYIILYTFLMSYLTILKMYAFRSSAWDLGNYNQAIYTFVFNGKLFYWTADLLGNPSGSLFGVHFSPIFFLLAVPYRLFPGPEMLLVIQSLGIAVGAIPVYLLASQELKSRKLALLLPLLYLLYPPLLGVNWFEFHPEAFIPAAFLFVIYYYQSQKWTRASLAVLFALSIMNETGLLLSALGISFLIEKRAQFVAMFRSRRLLEFQSVVFSLLMVAGGITWFVISTRIVDSLNPIGAGIYGVNYATLGVQTIAQIPLTVITHPDRAIAALLENWQLKVSFLFVLAVPFLFIPLLAPVASLPALVWILPALLSSYPPYYSLGLQYTAFVIPFIVYALILGLKRALPILGSRRLFHTLIVAAIFGLILSNPLLSLQVATHPWAQYGVPISSPKLEAERRLVALIPRNESVMTNSQFIFPLISSRLDAFVIPDTIPYVGISLFEYISSLVDKSDYIILDMDYDYASATGIILSRTYREFGVLGYANGLLLLKRGFQESPTMDEYPPSMIFTYKNLTIRSAIISHDSTSISGTVLNSTGGSVPGNDFWWGPYVFLTPGVYQVHVWLKEEYPIDGNALTLQTSAFPLTVNSFFMFNKKVLGKQVSTSEDLKKTIFTRTNVTGKMLNSETYTDILSEFTADTFGIYEFTGLNLQTNVPIYLDRIAVEMVRPLSYVKPIPISFENSPLIYYDLNHSRNIIQTTAMIPTDAQVLFQNELSPLVMKKGCVPLVPPASNANVTENYFSLLDSKLNSTDYLLMDWKANETLCSLVLSRPMTSRIFNLIAWNDGVMLFQRNYNGSMTFDNRYSVNVNWNTIIPKQGTRLEENDGVPALVHSNPSSTDFWWGPYLFLPPGTYNATLSIKSDYELQNGTIFTFQVNLFPYDFSTIAVNGSLKISSTYTGQKINLVNYDVASQEIGVNGYTEISVQFNAGYYGEYEFPGLSVMVSDNIYVSRIQITMIQPSSSLQIRK